MEGVIAIPMEYAAILAYPSCSPEHCDDDVPFETACGGAMRGISR